jgi:hypothetical protein
MRFADQLGTATIDMGLAAYLGHRAIEHNAVPCEIVVEYED